MMFGVSVLHWLNTEIINHIITEILFLFFYPFFNVCFIHEGLPYGTNFGSPEGGFPPPYADGYGVHMVSVFLNTIILELIQFSKVSFTLLVLLFRLLQRKVLFMGWVLLLGKHMRSLAQTVVESKWLMLVMKKGLPSRWLC